VDGGAPSALSKNHSDSTLSDAAASSAAVSLVDSHVRSPHTSAQDCQATTHAHAPRKLQRAPGHGRDACPHKRTLKRQAAVHSTQPHPNLQRRAHGADTRGGRVGALHQSANLAGHCGLHLRRHPLLHGVQDHAGRQLQQAGELPLQERERVHDLRGAGRAGQGRGERKGRKGAEGVCVWKKGCTEQTDACTRQKTEISTRAHTHPRTYSDTSTQIRGTDTHTQSCTHRTTHSAHLQLGGAVERQVLVLPQERFRAAALKRGEHAGHVLPAPQRAVQAAATPTPTPMHTHTYTHTCTRTSELGSAATHSQANKSMQMHAAAARCVWEGVAQGWLREVVEGGGMGRGRTFRSESCRAAPSQSRGHQSREWPPRQRWTQACSGRCSPSREHTHTHGHTDDSGVGADVRVTPFPHLHIHNLHVPSQHTPHTPRPPTACEPPLHNNNNSNNKHTHFSHNTRHSRAFSTAKHTTTKHSTLYPTTQHPLPHPPKHLGGGSVGDGTAGRDHPPLHTNTRTW
jgi:hypothetical protein